MGLQIAESAPDHCRQARREIIQRRLRQAIEEAHRSKIDPAEIEAILREEWARATASGSGNVR